MAIMPKRVKYRKNQRGSRKGIAVRGSRICFGEFGLKALGNGWMKNTQLEAARVALIRQLKSGGKLWVRVFPDKSVSKKPAETRQGKGKGDIEYWAAIVRRGKILFELGGIPEELARQSLRTAAYKLPFKTMFVTRGKQ